MKNIILHPACFICTNCRKIKQKKELNIYQDNTNTYYFCNECAKALEENLQKNK